jgi:glutamyl-tRNA synthetase
MTSATAPVRVRIAPSPTGDPHVGTAYIALFNTAFAKQRGGQFILRIEDTDQARSTQWSENAIFDALRWLGLDWDEGPDKGGPHAPYRQSERLAIYREHAQLLFKSGNAYWCDCSEERLNEARKVAREKKEQFVHCDGGCREKALASGDVLRLKVSRQPGEATAWNDPWRKQEPFLHSTFDDQILMKSDGFPTYHLANVVDDHLMNITHVMRGEEWISSTPKHILLYKAFGWTPPEFMHLPLLRNPGGSKVSKRKNPVSLSWFREAGYLPDAMVNFLGTMAHTMLGPDGKAVEIFSLQEFIENFRLERVVLGGPVFDLKKLLDINTTYLHKKRSDAERVQYLKSQLFSDAYLEQVVKACGDRWKKSEDFIEYAPYFFTGTVTFDVKEAVIKGKTGKETSDVLAEFVERVDVQYAWNLETVKALVEYLYN